MLAEVFPLEGISIRSYGNVLAAIASLTGMAFEELSSRELTKSDEYFPLLIAARRQRSFRRAAPSRCDFVWE